jgi:hypothetical protein
MMRRCILVVLIGFLLPPVAPAQSDSTASVNPVKAAVVGGVVGGTMVGIHLYQQNAWWKDHRTSFHFREDLVYACNVDKLGHFYASSLLTTGFSKSLLWVGLDEHASMLWAAIGSMAFETFVEIEDGLSAYWGFDRVDFASDVFGAWYPYLQYKIPVLKNFQMRFSYLPKNAGEANAIPGQTKTIFDDYEGQTMWLTVTPKGLLPEGRASWWPGFLALSLGVSVRNNSSPDRHLAVYLAPDLDMSEIIPSDTAFLRGLAEALNFIHFPMPAVRIAPGVVWYGLYF